MRRIGTIFKIKPELKDKYKKAHDEIWPEMAEAIRGIGIRNYSIFFKKDGTLFSYLETELEPEDFEKAMEEFSKKDTNIRWQKHMDKYFTKQNKSISGPETEMLEEVFHLD